MKKLLLLLLLSSMASADMVSYLNNQFIPVEKIELSGSTVIASYNMDLMLGPDEFSQDIAYVFGALAKEYPGSERIEVACFAEGEPMYRYSVSTSAVKAYAENKMSDEEFLASVSVEEEKAGFLDGNIMLLLGGAGVLIALIVFFFAALAAAAYLFMRRSR